MLEHHLFGHVLRLWYVFILCLCLTGNWKVERHYHEIIVHNLVPSKGISSHIYCVHLHGRRSCFDTRNSVRLFNIVRYTQNAFGYAAIDHCLYS